MLNFKRMFRDLALFLNACLARFIGLKLSRSVGIAENRLARNVFKNRTLKQSQNGYFYVYPMPSEKELDVYYKNTYWLSRSGKSYGSSARDFTHYHILKKLVPDFFVDKKKVIVNFGAGHGGLSNILWFEGFHMINIEPSGLPKSYRSRWECYPSLAAIEDNSVDFIYGSHSLEHVQDIDSFKTEVRRILKPGSLMFWEVPNACNFSSDMVKNKIDIPHTYYFKNIFFEKWFDVIILNDSFDSVCSQGIVDAWEEYSNPEGAVIRALGRIS